MSVPQAFISGRNMQLLWTIPKNYSFLNKIISFQIEFRSEGDEKWIKGAVIDEHQRAVAIRELLLGNRLMLFFLRGIQKKKYR